MRNNPELVTLNIKKTIYIYIYESLYRIEYDCVHSMIRTKFTLFSRQIHHVTVSSLAGYVLSKMAS